MTNLNSMLKSRDIFPTNVCFFHNQSYGFSSSHVQMWELDHKEGWVLKNWCFQIVVLEKNLSSPLDFKEIKPIHPKGNQPWIFIGRTDAEVKAPALWPPAAGPHQNRLTCSRNWVPPALVLFFQVIFSFLAFQLCLSWGSHVWDF